MNPVLQVIATLTEDGKLSVTAGGAHAGNKLMLLGLLEAAKGALQNQPEEKASPASSLILARGSLPPFNGHRG
jgi:hypothetical protein